MSATPALARAVVGCTLSLAAMLVAGCAGDGGSGMGGSSGSSSVSAASNAARQLVGDWNLASLEGVDVNSLLKARTPGSAPGFTIQPDGRLGGFGGVNRIMSKLDMEALAKGQFSLAPVASTMMAGPTESMNFEKRYTSLLGKARSFGLSGDTLTLKDDAGAELMQLVKQKPKK